MVDQYSLKIIESKRKKWGECGRITRERASFSLLLCKDTESKLYPRNNLDFPTRQGINNDLIEFYSVSRMLKVNDHQGW